MIAAFALTASHTTLLLGVGYGAAGVVVAVLLSRVGHPVATSVSALAVWPLLLPLLTQAPEPDAAAGPLAGRIDATFRAMERTLSDPAAEGVPWEGDLRNLELTLVRADARIALVDRLLADTPGEAGDGLREARERALAELEVVLEGVVRLRLGVGMLALSGDTSQVRAELDALVARAGALEELARLG